MENQLIIQVPSTQVYIPVNVIREQVRQILKEDYSALNLAIQPEKAGDLLTRKQASERLGVSLQTIHVWLKSGRLKGYRVGTRIRIKEADLKEAFIKI